MRIFIADYSLATLKTRVPHLKKYLVDEKTKLEIITNEGQYYIDNSKVYKMIVTDKSAKIYENYSNGVTLLVDNSYTVLQEMNQIPNHNIEITNTYFYFALNKSSKLRLVIQTHDETIENMDPCDFYFETKDETEINNIFFRDEINVFLSLLN